MVQNVLFRYGSQLQDQEGQRVTFNSPETIAGLRWLKETYTDQKWAKALPPGLLSWTDPSNNEAFLAGTIAITDNAGTMYAKAVLDKVPHAKQIAFIPRPKRIKDGVRLDSLAGSRHHVIKGTKNKAAVYDLVRHLNSEPVQKQIWQISLGYAVPPFTKGWDDPLIQNDAVAKAAQAIAFNPNPFSGYRWPGPPSAAIDTVVNGTYHTDMIGEAIQGKSAEDVAKDYHNRFVQIWKDNGFKGA
jgi:multiple sugar transport system substrate-binding protein